MLTIQRRLDRVHRIIAARNAFIGDRGKGVATNSYENATSWMRLLDERQTLQLHLDDAFVTFGC